MQMLNEKRIGGRDFVDSCQLWRVDSRKTGTRVTSAWRYGTPGTFFLPKLAALSGWRDIGLRNGGIVDARGCKPRSKGTPARRESGKGVALSTRLALGGACLTAVMEAEREGVSRLCRAKA
jgi:hypothetical protein